MEHIGERLIWYYVPFTDVEIPGGGINALTVLNTIFGGQPESDWRICHAVPSPCLPETLDLAAGIDVRIRLN